MDRNDASPAMMVRTAWTLAALGYLPFLLGAFLLFTSSPDSASFDSYVLLTALYGSIILTFLGGIRWGHAIAAGGGGSPGTLVGSIVPSFGAFFATAAAADFPSSLPFAALAVFFAVHGVWDLMATRKGLLPQWFGKLRLALTLAVTATLAAAGFAIWYRTGW
jgi:hypothetical protein